LYRNDGGKFVEIAAAAGTAMSSITYHYGGKEGLYLAAADHISSRMAEGMSPALLVEVADGEFTLHGAGSGGMGFTPRQVARGH